MNDENKTKDQLRTELAEVRQRLRELRKVEVKRKKAEEALQADEECLWTLLDQFRDTIFITSREGNFIHANQAFLALLGYTSNEITHLKMEDI